MSEHHGPETQTRLMTVLAFEKLLPEDARIDFKLAIGSLMSATEFDLGRYGIAERDRIAITNRIDAAIRDREKEASSK